MCKNFLITLNQSFRNDYGVNCRTYSYSVTNSSSCCNTQRFVCICNVWRVFDIHICTCLSFPFTVVDFERLQNIQVDCRDCDLRDSTSFDFGWARCIWVDVSKSLYSPLLTFPQNWMNRMEILLHRTGIPNCESVRTAIHKQSIYHKLKWISKKIVAFPDSARCFNSNSLQKYIEDCKWFRQKPFWFVSIEPHTSSLHVNMCRISLWFSH